jgi:type IV secretion system protein VirB4
VCDLTGFLNYVVTGDLRHDLPPLSANLSACLPSAEPQFAAEGQICLSLPLPTYHKLIVVNRWPEGVDGRLVGKVMALDGEADITQVCLPIPQDVAGAQLDRKIKESGTFGSALMGEEMVAAKELVATEQIWWSTQYHITVRSTDQATLDQLVSQVCELLSIERVRYVVETKGAAIAWLNRLPDHGHLLRPLRLFSDAISALWPFPFSPGGRHACPWGTGPVRLFQTGSGQAYSFQFHLKETNKSLGNYLVFASSGSGKSTLIAYLLAGLMRHKGVHSYIFDSKEGTRFMVEAFGGTYQNYDRLALNPLTGATNDESSRQRLRLLIRQMLGAAAELGSDAIVDHLIDIALQQPPEQRSFNAIFDLCVPRDTPHRAALARWVIDAKGRKGAYAHIFNAPLDGLSGVLAAAPLVGINMNEALADDHLAPPVITHIVEEILRQKHKGFNIFIDEAANLLRNPEFKKHVAFMYCELRKLNGAVGLAFQNPAVLHKSGIAEEVIENTATFIFFPNPQGRRADYEVFNLNAEQKEFIFNSPAGGGRRVLVVKRDPSENFEESLSINVDLSKLADGGCTKYFASGTDALADLERLQAKWGDQWAQYL